tara:strand:+ start:484 stop:621 length:138 start_codon:yes stop_codon:yes gene_type:complete
MTKKDNNQDTIQFQEWVIRFDGTFKHQTKQINKKLMPDNQKKKAI